MCGTCRKHKPSRISSSGMKHQGTMLASAAAHPSRRRRYRCWLLLFEESGEGAQQDLGLKLDAQQLETQ